MPLMDFFRRRKERKELKARIAAARVFLWTNADILPADAAGALRTAIAARDGAALGDLLARLDPPRRFAFFREWLDIGVVALSAAMAFRAYWFEPFNIPTGSMHPTLFGAHSRLERPENRTAWDSQPLRFFKWAATGERFLEIRAPRSGTVNLEETGEGMCRVTVAGEVAGEVPMDATLMGRELDWSGMADGRPVERYRRVVKALRGLGPNGEERDAAGAWIASVEKGERVREGQLLWCGTAIPGDFLFVNRFAWNFARPKRGEVMVFNTTGIERLGKPKTHYIKRMVGLPGEKVSIDEPYLVINGRPVTEPEKIRQVSGKEKMAPWAPPYAGYVNIPDGECLLPSPDDSVTLGPDEYFACGDNQRNSWDSRFWGPVPGDRLVGRASFVFWPFASPHWGFIE